MNNTAEETGEGRNIPVQGGPGQEEYEHGSDIRSGTRRKTSSQSRSKPQTCKTGSPSPTRWGAVAVICLCCMTGAGAGGYFFYRANAPEPAPGLRYESNIVSGDIPGKTREERQRELNSVVEEGMLNMSMNITPSGQVSGTAAERSINWLIENPSNQGKLIRVEVTRDDTGEKIYETGAIRPGNYVESAPLDVRLPAGEYACTAVFFAYQEDTEALIGQAAVKIKLTLQE